MKHTHKPTDTDTCRCCCETNLLKHVPGESNTLPTSNGRETKVKRRDLFFCFFCKSSQSGDHHLGARLREKEEKILERVFFGK